MFPAQETGLQKRAADAGAKRGRKASIRRVHSLLPARPKKVPTGYGLFIKAYWAHQNPSKPGNLALIEKNSPPTGVTFDFSHVLVKKTDPLTGRKYRMDLKIPAAAWNNLAASQKEAYRARAEADLAGYRTRRAEWEAFKKEIKRPATAYAIFVKEIWNRERESGRSFAEMSKYASGLWENLSEAEKEHYKNQYRLNANEYRHRVEFLRVNGRLPTEQELQIQIENADSADQDEDEVDNNGFETDMDTDEDEDDDDDGDSSEDDDGDSSEDDEVEEDMKFKLDFKTSPFINL